MKQTKNIIILDSVIKYNAVTLYKERIIRIPDYLIDLCYTEGKDLIITHNNKVLKAYRNNQIIPAIYSVDSKIMKGTFNKQEIEFKLTLLKY